MEKKKEVLNEIHEYCKSVSTGLGEMFIGYDEWFDIVDDAEFLDGEIYLLKRRNGERVYQVVCHQYEKYDRINDFNDKCVDVFEYNSQEVITLQDVYNRCFDHRYEEALYHHDFEAFKDLADDFKRIENYIDEYLTSEYFLAINEYLSPDVVERYPMVWFEDVYEYRIALKLPSED